MAGYANEVGFCGRMERIGIGRARQIDGCPVGREWAG